MADQQQQPQRRPYGGKPTEVSAELAQVAAPAPKGVSTINPVPLAGPIATLDDAYRYAYAMAQSGLLPKSLAFNAPNTLIVILYGQYLGIPPVIATQVISVVNGRPQIEGKMLVAKVREAGHKYRPVEHTSEKCRVRITRHDEPDEPYEAEFTIEEAIKAGLCYRDPDSGEIRARSDNNKPLPWETYTKEMLQWRATARCVNVACPEVKMGLAIEGEETTDFGGGSRTERLGKVAADRTDKQPVVADTDPEVIQDDVAAQLAAMESAHGPVFTEEVADAEVVPDDSTVPPAATNTADAEGGDRWDEVLDAERSGDNPEQGKRP